jgi:N-acetyl-anhydromuramyl-L-alanine amidase AmpD
MTNTADFLVIHNSATPYLRPFTGHDIDRWHRFPKDLESGKVRYMGKIYDSRSKLPDERIHGQPIQFAKGNGWSVPGYYAVIRVNGIVDVLVENDFDRYIQSNEITNGVRGYNDRAIHICLIGGTDKANKKPFMQMTNEQMDSLKPLLYLYKKNNSSGKIVGHSYLDPNGKPNCPGESVIEWLKCEKLYG